MENILATITSIIADLISSFHGFAEAIIPAGIMEPAQDMLGNTLTEIAPYWNEVWGGIVNSMF